MIKEYIRLYEPLQSEFLPMYAQPEGRQIYEESLKSTQKFFPQYVSELQGVADGAGVPFHEVSKCFVIIQNNNNTLLFIMYNTYIKEIKIYFSCS